MKILLSGASGLIGSALQQWLTDNGHRAARLVRSTSRTSQPSQPESDSVEWDPVGGRIDRPALEGFDAVVHLVGENVARGRWTQAKKARIRDSRVRGTRLLSEALAGLTRRPKVFASASAIGFYGDRGDETLDEQNPPGSGFLAEVCRDWEASRSDDGTHAS